MKDVLKLMFASIAITLGVCMVIIGAGSKMAVSEPIRKLPAIVRLHTAEGRFFCSGTVISDTKVLTAAHCLAWMPAGSTVSIRPDTGVDAGVNSVLYTFNERADVGMITGNFTNFEHMQIETDAESIVRAFQHNDLKLCGYPWAGKLYCNSFKFTNQYLEHMEGDAHAWPGMSGGPVIDNSTGKVIANLMAITEQGQVIVNPLIELEAMLEL